jgi:hypothetical protein
VAGLDRGDASGEMGASQPVPGSACGGGPCWRWPYGRRWGSTRPAIRSPSVERYRLVPVKWSKTIATLGHRGFPRYFKRSLSAGVVVGVDEGEHEVYPFQPTARFGDVPGDDLALSPRSAGAGDRFDDLAEVIGQASTLPGRY